MPSFLTSDDFLSAGLVPYTVSPDPEEPTECSICRFAEPTDFVKIATCPCKHYPYHRECIATWLASNSTAPCCRIQLYGRVPPPHNDFNIPVQPEWATETEAFRDRYCAQGIDQDSMVETEGALINANIMGQMMIDYGNRILQAHFNLNQEFEDAEIHELMLVLSNLYHVLNQHDGEITDVMTVKSWIWPEQFARAGNRLCYRLVEDAIEQADAPDGKTVAGALAKMVENIYRIAWSLEVDRNLVLGASGADQRALVEEDTPK